MRTQTTSQFQFLDFAGPGGHFHALRHRYAPGASSTLHCHDFAEVLWVDEGEGTHFVNGRRERLARGYLRFARARDCHELVSSAAHPIRLSNVAFSEELLDWLVREFTTEAGYRWLQWLDGEGFLLESASLESLSLLFDRLAAGPQSRLAIDHFLVGLVGVLELSVSEVVGRDGAPAWFSRAVDAVATHPTLLRLGLPGLVRSAGGSMDHVNRTCRRYLTKTATDLVNELRLEHAARLLHASEADIVDVALQCGFDNLSHFYHLFKSHYGLPPNRFRNRELTIIRAKEGE